MKFTRESLNVMVILLGAALLIGWYSGNWIFWILLALVIGVAYSYKSQKK